jgi:hypothetical protein
MVFQIKKDWSESLNELIEGVLQRLEEALKDLRFKLIYPKISLI